VISVIESSHYDLGPVLRVGQVFEKDMDMEEKSMGFGRACVGQ